MIENMTGKPLGAQAWVDDLNRPVESYVASEKKIYEAALSAGPKYKPGDSVDLDMTVRFVHGDLVISDSAKDGGLLQACKIFKEFVANM